MVMETTLCDHCHVVKSWLGFICDMWVRDITVLHCSKFEGVNLFKSPDIYSFIHFPQFFQASQKNQVELL